jgi:hypothetical protein
MKFKLFLNNRCQNCFLKKGCTPNDKNCSLQDEKNSDFVRAYSAFVMLKEHTGHHNRFKTAKMYWGTFEYNIWELSLIAKNLGTSG